MAGPKMNTTAGANALKIAKLNAPMAKLVKINVNDRFYNGN